MVKTRVTLIKKKTSKRNNAFPAIRKKVNANRAAKKTLRLKLEMPLLKQSRICTISAASINKPVIKSRS